MLEMYCGCGAHTVPLAKSAILTEIVAVELDGRLVDACRDNCRRNDCLQDHDDDGNDNDRGGDGNGLECSVVQSHDRTSVRVFKGDAGEWAAKTLRIRKRCRDEKAGQSPSSSSSKNTVDEYNDFDILLVDPPRDGLSSTVCGMALEGTFAHVVYVSCGRRALLRDLTMLCSAVGGFDVEDIAVIDLFPGTDAVETLVHLKRRDAR